MNCVQRVFTSDKRLLVVGELGQSGFVASFRLALGGHSLFHDIRVVAVDVDRMGKPAELELERPLGGQGIGGTVGQRFLPVHPECYRHLPCKYSPTHRKTSRHDVFCFEMSLLRCIAH